MLKTDIVRFLKEIGKTYLEFSPYKFKGLDANEYHWDKYLTGDLYDVYNENSKFYRFSDLTVIEENTPKYPIKHLDNMIAACDVDNLLILFLGYNSDDVSLDLYATEHAMDSTPAYRLLGIFKLDELSKEGFIIKINFSEDTPDA